MKVVVISGASSGIGLATAKFLSEKGFKVYGLSRRIVENQNFESVSCDMTNHEMVKQTFQNIFEKEGKIDVLINNAGMGIAGAIEHTSEEDIKKQFDLNLFAVINSCKCIIPLMRKNGGGKIINISSVAGVIPIPFQTCYATTKAAIDMFSMSFGVEVEDFGIKVSVVMPGDTKTGFTENRIKNELLEDENYKDRISKSIKKMEQDEIKGKSPISVSKVIFKIINKKNPPAKVTVGFSYKLFVFMKRIVSRRFMLWVIKKLYG